MSRSCVNEHSKCSQGAKWHYEITVGGGGGFGHNGERDTASPRLWAMLRTQASGEEADDVFSRRPLYCGHAGSDVMGCRRPAGGVFTYVSSDTSHAEGVPRSDP